MADDVMTKAMEKEADIEEFEDVLAFDRAKTGAYESLPFEQAVREIEEGLVGELSEHC